MPNLGHAPTPGAWSDGSDEWTRYPQVRRKLRPCLDGGDGAFWIPFESWREIYGSVDVCDRTTDRDLHLHTKEDYGSKGLAWGFCKGSMLYWLACRSCRVIYGGHVTESRTKSAKRGVFGIV